MRLIWTITFVSLLATSALGQQHSAPNQTKVKEELQKLFSDLNEAITKKDRAALDRIYADEFQFVHGNGYVVDKATQIKGIMNNDSLTATPVNPPDFEGLLIYQDVVMYRRTERGLVGSNVYVKRDGRWQIVQVQGTRLAPERRPVPIDPQLLDRFLGKYQFGPNAIATVTREGDVLKWRGGNRLPVTLVPLSENRFFAKEAESEMTFNRNDRGVITDVVLKLGVCQESRARKIE